MKKISFISLAFILLLSTVPFVVSAQVSIPPSSYTAPSAAPAQNLQLNSYPPTPNDLNSGSNGYLYLPTSQSSAATPSSAGASLAACQNLNGIQSVANCTLGIINLIIPIIVALTVIWTIYSSFELARTEGDDRKKWGQMIFFGLLGIFLMISVYGLIAIFTGTFGFNGTGVTVPNVNNAVRLGN